jgi:hypothetical protein
MNEIQLIRSQLGAERDRAGAVALACAGALAGADAQSVAARLAAFRQASVEYLTCVLGWFEERDQRLRELNARRPVDDPERRCLEQLLAGAGSSREALERLERVAGSRAGDGATGARGRPEQQWQEFARFIAGPWKARRDAIEQRLSSRPRTADWRAVAGIDADSILEERRRYAQVRQHLPAGAAATAGP